MNAIYSFHENVQRGEAVLPKNNRPPTMVDVAREAGVALGTVSRVLNGQSVGQEFRERVQQAIEKLGYEYKSGGKQGHPGGTGIIALIIPNTINPFFALLVHHINIALEKRGCRMMLCFTEYDRDQESDFIQMAAQNRVDGIIALTYNPNLKIPEGIPFVTIDRFFSASVPCVAADNFGGGYIAAQKLAELGCRHLAFLRIGSTLTNEPSKRKDGFVSACVELGVSFEIMALDDGMPVSRFREFLEKHMQDGKFDLDGLFVGTDTLAWQVMRMLREMGVRVPEDVQVIGFDGIRMFGEQNYVVSSIAQPVEEIAETCVSTVLSRHMSTLPSLICLPVKYVYGGTTLEERGE